MFLLDLMLMDTAAKQSFIPKHDRNQDELMKVKVKTEVWQQPGISMFSPTSVFMVVTFTFSYFGTKLLIKSDIQLNYTSTYVSYKTYVLL